MQHLGDDDVRHLVIHLAGDEDDPLAQQPRVDVEGALAARVLLDDHRDQWHWGVSLLTSRRPPGDAAPACARRPAACLRAAAPATPSSAWWRGGCAGPRARGPAPRPRAPARA